MRVPPELVRTYDDGVEGLLTTTQQARNKVQKAMEQKSTIRNPSRAVETIVDISVPQRSEPLVQQIRPPDTIPRQPEFLPTTFGNVHQVYTAPVACQMLQSQGLPHAIPLGLGGLPATEFHAEQMMPPALPRDEVDFELPYLSSGSSISGSEFGGSSFYGSPEAQPTSDEWLPLDLLPAFDLFNTVDLPSAILTDGNLLGDDSFTMPFGNTFDNVGACINSYGPSAFMDCQYFYPGWENMM
jgi:hypothetical protein